jgi:hypothetical protein
MMKVTHSAALKPPAGSPYCEDCGHTWTGCRCGEPTCEDCGDWATRKITVDDCDGWACEDCASRHEGAPCPS